MRTSERKRTKTSPNNIRAFISGRFTPQHSRSDCVENLPFQSLSETQFRRGQARFLLLPHCQTDKIDWKNRLGRRTRLSYTHCTSIFLLPPPPSFPLIYLLSPRCPSSLAKISTDWFRRRPHCGSGAGVVRNTESSGSDPGEKNEEKRKAKAYAKYRISDWATFFLGATVTHRFLHPAGSFVRNLIAFSRCFRSNANI